MAAEIVWTMEEWKDRASRLTRMIIDASGEISSIEHAVLAARKVLRSYSTSFYLVTRFLPLQKRKEVELIYAAVRYPDELVDSFAGSGIDVIAELESWKNDFRDALDSTGLRQSCRKGLNPYVSAFATLVKKHGIPPEYYYSFLEAMQSDLEPQGFATEEELIDGYVYGSATVVGYFLTYVYGTERAEDFNDALDCARDLAIALQLTNFARDVQEDYCRGRLYAPLKALGLENATSESPTVNSLELLRDARIWLASKAMGKYRQAADRLALFSADSRVAMECCIRVYSMLNQQLLKADAGLTDRMSVPWFQKFAALPPSKYWRLPLAYTGFM